MELNKLMITGVIIGILLVSLILWFSVFREHRIIELGDYTFEELCKRNGDQWMEMEETRKGKPTSDAKCFGCMIADSHFCDVNGYTEYVKRLPSFVR